MADALSFAMAMERLESVVRTLEAGGLSLEEALHCYREGMGLVRYCHRQLEVAEKKVKLLLENEDAGMAATVFDIKPKVEARV